MSTLTEEPVAAPSGPERESRVGEAPLATLLGTRYALGLKHFYATLAFGALFIAASYMPLFHTDLWGHVAYGRYILDTQAIPAEDPFLPLASGVPIVDTMWLSQIILAKVNESFGPEQLSTLFAVTVLAMYVALAWAMYLQSGRVSLAMLGVVLVFAIIGWNRHLVIRPEMFGGLAFAIVLWIVVRAQKTADEEGGLPPQGWSAELKFWPLWIGVPVTFALWANLHGSYVMGFAVLGCCLVGRVIEVARLTPDFNAIIADRWVRRWLVACELAVAGTLVNPYGMDLLVHNLLFAGHPNLKDVTEWHPLVLASPVGWGFAFSWALAIVVLRHSRREVKPAEALLLIVFSLAAMLHVRMVSWYAPVAILVLMPHLAEIAARLWPEIPLIYCNPMDADQVPVRQRCSYSFTLVCLGAAFVCFELSSTYMTLVHKLPRANLYSSQTPQETTAWLREHPPQGQIWNTQMWGDWIAWDARDADGRPPKVFMTTNIHVAPPRVWQDYLHVFSAAADWESILNRYRVETVVVDKEEQEMLASVMRRSPEWRVAHEDDLALVFERAPNRKLTPSATETPGDDPAANLPPVPPEQAESNDASGASQP